MGSKDQHLRKAEHNEAFFKQFDLVTTVFIDWVVTGIFYSALHYLRAVAARMGFQNVSSYADVDRLFSSLAPFKRDRRLWTDYRQLKDDSRDARYEMRTFKSTDVEDLRDNEFQRIRAFARRELGLP